MTWVDGAPEDAPLVPLRTSGDTEGEVQRLLAKFEGRGNDPDILKAVANSERMLKVWVAMVDALMYRASLPARDREVAILRLAAHGRCRYEWQQHDPIAVATGVDRDVVDAFAKGDEAVLAERLAPSERLTVRIVDVVVADERAIPDDLWAEARATWGDEGATDLLFSIAFWGGFVPLLIRMFRL